MSEGSSLEDYAERSMVSAENAITLKENSYVLEKGVIFTSPSFEREAKGTRMAMVLLALDSGNFELRIGGRSHYYEAVAVKPLVTRFAKSECGVVGFLVAPNHPHFRAFRGIARPGALPLQRQAFLQHRELLDAAYYGRLNVDAAATLLDDVIAAALPFLPKTKPLDPRIKRIMDMVDDNANRNLNELANLMSLSYDRMSHLFAEGVGLPLRSYQLWRKMYNATKLLESGCTFTEVAHVAGFTDVNHFRRIFIKAYGRPPTSYFRTDRIRLVSIWERKNRKDG